MKKAVISMVSYVLSVLFFITSVSAQFASTDFLIADAGGNRIAVYDQNLVFLRYLDTSFNQVHGLTLLPGALVAAGRSPGTIKVYNQAGTVVQSFSDANIASVVDIKASGAGLLYVGSRATPSSVPEFTVSGTLLRNIGAKSYAGIAVLPGNILWASDAGSNTIDVFDITTGALTSTITLDNGEVNASSMFYSPSTNTVLIADAGTSSVFERTTTGAFIRQFTGGAALGVTRGPGGVVLATSLSRVYRWTSTGTFIDSTDITANVTSPRNIVWAGNIVPTAASVSISGRVSDAGGRGIARAIVLMTEPNGTVRTSMTNTFGYFHFEEITVGNSYVFEITCKGYSSTSRVITVNDEITDLDFTLDE